MTEIIKVKLKTYSARRALFFRIFVVAGYTDRTDFAATPMLTFFDFLRTFGTGPIEWGTLICIEFTQTNKAFLRIVYIG